MTFEVEGIGGLVRLDRRIPPAGQISNFLDRGFLRILPISSGSDRVRRNPPDPVGGAVHPSDRAARTGSDPTPSDHQSTSAVVRFGHQIC